MIYGLWILVSSGGVPLLEQRGPGCVENGAFKSTVHQAIMGAILILRFLGFRIRIVSFVVNSRLKPGGELRWAGGRGGARVLPPSVAPVD